MREESGFALVTTIMLMLISLGIGMAVLARADGQTRQSADERTKESSFDLAEAALNTQALQLSRSWPGPTATTSPTSCDPTSTSTACPVTSDVANGYTTKDYNSSCTTSTGTPLWQTTVRDNAPSATGTADTWWTTAVTSRAAYDLNNDGLVWVRATAMVQCNKVSVVSIVSRSSVPMTFPSNVITANWFQTSNQGRKVIVDTLGTYANPPQPQSQAAPIVLRCQNITGTCANYQTGKGQVQPANVQTNSTSTATTLSLTQLQSLERQASSAGTLYTCPPSGTSLNSVNGAPVVVTGPASDGSPCQVNIGGNTVVNSSSSPGVLVVENGTVNLSGTAYFYGLIYCVNKQGSTGSVVTIGGNATVQGSISVDGGGGITAGSSKTNLIYDPRAAASLRGESGAVLNKNTFRVLPPSTP